MAIQWRQLLDAAGVRWIDRGHNTSKGNINVRCPWCGPADPSFHLGIKEATGEFYCLRTGGKHRGKSPYWLLANGFSLPGYEIDALLRDHSDDRPPARPQRHHETAEWDQFKSAADYPAAVEYLLSRGIDPPRLIAKRYDLRCADTGTHGWRILLPLHLNQSIVGWTGRAIRDQIPRYRAHDPSDGAALYIPVYPTEATRAVVIVEGPFDALAISDAYYPTHEIVAVAVTGLNINSRRRRHLVDVIEMMEKPRVLLTLDADQSRQTVEDFKKVLVCGPSIQHPESFPLPPGFKDAGEMTRGQIKAWLNSLGDDL